MANVALLCRFSEWRRDLGWRALCQRKSQQTCSLIQRKERAFIIEPEIYLIVIWQHANIGAENILGTAESHGLQVRLNRAELASEDQLDFIRRLYFDSVTDFGAKLERVGCNWLHVGIVFDSNPNYQTIHTSRGYRRVNKKVVEFKQALRLQASVADGVHISDTKEESKHNIFLAFSLTYDQVLEDFNFVFNPYRPRCLLDIFTVMNHSIEYVVQRNFHEIFNRDGAFHGDIDLLVRDSESVARLIGAEPATNDKTRKLYKIFIGEKEVLIDLREASENYYDPIWSMAIISRRELDASGSFYKPCLEDEIYMTAYHALLHKFEWGDDYLQRLRHLTSDCTKRLETWPDVLSDLRRFLEKSGYRVTIPWDKTVKINPVSLCALSLNPSAQLSRVFYLPEHHARNFALQIIKHGKMIFEKEGSIHRSKVFVGASEPFSSLVIKLVQAKDCRFAPYLYNEAHYASLLGNEFAPIVLASFIDNGWLCLVLERIKGETVSSLYEKSLISQADYQAIEKELYRLLQALKDKNIVHRDLRGENLIFTKGKKIKVIDFGVAKSALDADAITPEQLAASGDDDTDIQNLLAMIRPK